MRAPRGFKFDEFDTLCGELDGDQLQLKWQHYTRALSAASTSTAVATLAAGPTGGVSMIGAMIAGPLIHNARKKRQIIEHHMSIKGIEPETRNKDVYGPMAFSAVLGGATMGIGSVGAELLAVDTATKIVSHAAIDAGVTAVEDKHSQREHEKEMNKAGAQLVRANTANASLGAPMNPNIGQVLLKHATSMPASLGTTANGLIASAARLKTERYPLLKEYLTSVSFQSRERLSTATSKEDVPHAPFPATTIRKNESNTLPSSSLAPIRETAFVAELEDTSPSSVTFSRDPVELDSTPLTAPSELDACSTVSPLSPPSVGSHWPSPPQSFVSELEDTSSPGSSSFPASTWSSELPADADTVISSLLDAIDETTLGELENDLEKAVVEMDNPETWVKEETGAAASTSATKRMSRTFELPSDLDSLVRRHSTRFSRRVSQRDSNMRCSLYSFVEGEDKLNIASVATLRKPASQATLRTTASSSSLLTPKPDGDQRVTQSHDDLTKTFPEDQPRPLRRAASNHSIPPAYSAIDTISTAAYGNADHATEMQSPSSSVRGRQNEAWIDEKRRSVDPVMHSRHPSLRPRVLPFSPNDVYSPAGEWLADESSQYQARQQQQPGESSRGAVTTHNTNAHDGTVEMYNPPLEPGSSPRGSPLRAKTYSSGGSMSSLKSRTGSLALSAHESMKKVGYLGLEPATKLAIGGSLLMVGVRPSVQRKYLDKAKGKMGMPVEEKGNNGFMGMGKQKHRHEDDDYRDYI
ncbi:hypothetical protein J7T55_002263 [Diaporthe amygdali]|uniref:uncharacterized protein n=1 Tax=Phomopsis amygdali TaxID=1214568 RepID=UPI0022FEAFDD|nr:uncharacterized protein J7T55_002263 [Diaporthe amygdali]KAJ0109071.1 hypothetical protein J7T55_002263 [Diaporthe amygdali]